MSLWVVHVKVEEGVVADVRVLVACDVGGVPKLEDERAVRVRVREGVRVRARARARASARGRARARARAKARARVARGVRGSSCSSCRRDHLVITQL